MERQPHIPEQSERTDPRIEEALGILDAGLDKVMSQEGFKQFLEFQAQLYSYSPKNTMLIWSQKPDAMMVNSFDRWKKMGRWVRKGERGLKIFVPMLRKERDVDPETGEVQMVETLTGFRIGNVFDVSQTDGRPLPNPPEAHELTTSSENARQLTSNLKQWVEGESVTIKHHTNLADYFGRPTEAKGYYIPGKKIMGILLGMGDDQTAKTTAHESAHFVADVKKFDVINREDHETIAESSAFVVAHKYGIDTSDYSFAYVSGWAGDKERFASNLQYIQQASKTIINGVESLASTEKPVKSDPILVTYPSSM